MFELLFVEEGAEPDPRARAAEQPSWWAPSHQHRVRLSSSRNAEKHVNYPSATLTGHWGNPGAATGGTRGGNWGNPKSWSPLPGPLS